MSPTIRRHPDRTGLQLLDPIEGVRYDLYLQADDIDVEQRDPNAVPIPADAVARVRARRVILPKRLQLIVRDGDLGVVGTVEPDAPATPGALTPGESYLLEVTSAPLKLYLQVRAPFAIHGRGNQLDVAFDAPTSVDVAIRSFHEAPAGTITVGEGVRDEMEAISRFGSALKTTSPERAWPTLRGHPPLIERGGSDDLDVPDAVDRPATGVELHVPPERSYIYPAAPLAYYLGARLEPTSGDPRLVAGDASVGLDEDDYASDLNTVLRRMVLLDVAARTEGMYPYTIARHEEVEAVVEDAVDWARLFDLPLDERVAAYLDPRFDPVVAEGLLPEWHLTTDVSPVRSSLDVLPWVARDLSLVRIPDRVRPGDLPREPREISAFVRQPDDGDGGRDELSVIRPATAPTPEHRWIGDATPLEAQKPDADALRRHLSRLPPEKDDHVISIDVVVNDEAMASEGVVEEAYGVRELLEYDVRTHYSLTQGELEAVLTSPSDLLHYVGHVDDDGIQCVDGALDAWTLTDVGVDLFVLNACRSYHQGQALLDAGSLAGVVTLANVANVTATRVGKQLARLLNTGLRFRSALAILQRFVPTSYRYIVLGAGNLQLVQSESGAPYVVALEEAGERSFEVGLTYYPASGFDVGSLVTPVFDTADHHYLGMGSVGPFVLDDAELLSFFDLEEVPVVVRDELTWSSDVAMALRRETETPLEDVVVDQKWGTADGTSTGPGPSVTDQR